MEGFSLGFELLVGKLEVGELVVGKLVVGEFVGGEVGDLVLLAPLEPPVGLP